MSLLVYQTALSFNEHIGPRRYALISQKFPGLASYFDLSPADQMEAVGIRNPEQIRYFTGMLKNGETVVNTCRKLGIRILTHDSPEYPESLKTIPDAPFLLYVWGSLQPELPRVAIVGTRQTTPEALNIAQYFARTLSQLGFSIVSGLAHGHDQAAHHATLSAGGHTIGVLGCGIDQVFPAGSDSLYKMVRENGALVSEYAPGAPGFKAHFPLRNRIISGLSRAVLLIQAPEKSGALITARYAAEQNRELYVVPGDPTNRLYSGTNRLIQNGARLALNPDEIALDLLGQKPMAPALNNLTGRLARFEPDERKILEILTAPQPLETIREKTGMSLPELHHRLMMLEMQGAVVQTPGQFYHSQI